MQGCNGEETNLPTDSSTSDSIDITHYILYIDQIFINDAQDLQRLCSSLFTALTFYELNNNKAKAKSVALKIQIWRSFLPLYFLRFGNS